MAALGRRGLAAALARRGAAAASLRVLAFAALAVPWFVAMEQRVPGFADYFFVEQHFRRYAAGSFNNERPARHFFVALPLLTLPWSLWVPAAPRWARSGPWPWWHWRCGSASATCSVSSWPPAW